MKHDQTPGFQNYKIGSRQESKMAAVIKNSKNKKINFSRIIRYHYPLAQQVLGGIGSVPYVRTFVRMFTFCHRSSDLNYNNLKKTTQTNLKKKLH